MKKLAAVLSIFTIVACGTKETKLEGKLLIEKSNQFHDKNEKWSNAVLKIHIQEPRVGNYKRYSVVSLDNKNNTFELQRNRDHHISTHKVTHKGNLTLLNDSIVTDSILIKKYRLEPNRNGRYHRFYKVLLGLPMSLKNETFVIGKAEKATFNNKESYIVPIELKEPLFSKNWNLYFSLKDYKMIGLEMIFPNEPTKGERLIFEGTFQIDDMILTRIRHWRELNNEYAGSDIIVDSIN
ncbi:MULTISPECIES: DUF6503 family protein [unclassified Tenacibaculum]|uniref:DUF6503 family protein n=1 Tax=unclassified Tenacibaculum TaxID=2635139 RepID=UPI001F19E681|nr:MULTISPECIES: DUF6503 family protein [unclassified Tenacibaculum]MCF2874807.1 DUF6503 family protein [Tenacibaculum sp. Cn5-1]MCF2934127.1 DUF6503 family protein [Tenacibaculum sp. Cn5-34]MCG7510337.1 DUF6503 family protein [Tenacibaculum sp. Cn5-46]